MPAVALIKFGSTERAASTVAQMLDNEGVETIMLEGFEQQLNALPLLYLLVFIDSLYDMARSFLEVYQLRKTHRLSDTTAVVFLVDDRLAVGRRGQSDLDLEFFLKEIARVDFLWYRSFRSLDKDPYLRKLLSSITRRLKSGEAFESSS